MVDNSHITSLITYLRHLGLSQEEAAIYVSLTEQGGGTPLSISRVTGINRTKVYRTIETLSQSKLVNIEVREHSSRVTPVQPERLAEIVKQRQQQAAELARNYPDMERKLAELGVKSRADTKVRFYRGKQGIEQMVWNVLKAKSEVVGYTYRDLADFVGEKYMGDFAAEFVRRNLAMRDIYSDEYVKGKKSEQDWGGHIKSRYLPDKILAIPHQMDIYDDVVSFYNWHEGEVFGVEIHNEKVARLQKQLFELAWEKAEKRPS